MHSILATITMARGALTDCTFRSSKCQWVGTAPFCGHHADHGGHLGIDPPHQGWLTATDTEDESISELYDRKGSNFKGCYNDYGKGCWTGYKALYCEPGSKRFASAHCAICRPCSSQSK